MSTIADLIKFGELALKRIESLEERVDYLEKTLSKTLEHLIEIRRIV